ncbi:hypothetical protein [Edaphobacter modestus]|uniref:Uncharacterized protein n=1 Tax=Edaphobacter modestus TaxID=388466 RepID=A0A4Q7YZF3_9BACT|nr:hypothetical protein [Edaphobacter modestus]RZU42613.1 hypothetical protein BDD14_4204 [Edaphobacter modestus]
MPVPCIILASLRFRKTPSCVLLAVMLVFVTNCGLAKGPEPAKRIPLAPLGFQTPLTQFMLAGSSMLTVDFVDPHHLLLTYSAKRLLKRLPECPASDQDRVVEAVLVDVPSGRTLARTSWRTHDHGQYLWNLGRGRFLLRIRDTLSTFAPLVNLASGDTFRQRPFLRTDRRIGGVLLSPDADLMILETMDPPRPQSVAGDEAKGQETPVQIDFLRLVSLGGDEMDARHGGGLRSRVPGRIPANSAGYIAILDQGQQHWGFDFRSYGGKVKELASFDSTCRPSPMLVSRSEFIAFGCHLSHTPQIVAAFNMRGEAMWEQNMTESYISPMFSYAPGSGRFALSRILTRSSLVDSDSLAPELFDGQVVVVYQTDSGRQLLRIDASPIARAGQNFALAPDGLSLAVVRNEALEVYSLPPLTSKEREAVQMAEASAPPVDGDPALLLSSGAAASSSNEGDAPSSSASPSPAVQGGEAGASDSTVGPPAKPPELASDAGATEAPAATETGERKQETGAARTETSPAGDSPEQPRRPPTLYSPGESRDNTAPPQERPR